jgi:lipopolysaccharide transport system ATP-binding protein
MSLPIIEIEKISKLYRLGIQKSPTFQDTVNAWMGRRKEDAAALQKNTHHIGKGQQGPRPGTFWALKDISFSVDEGEIIGVMGRNGAGKTTLLKILSRITEPTEGRAVLRGRISSLLEVGMGFHPNLTGRENVFLKGAILGMRRPEIQSKYQRIVDFSEIGKFIDTPVKHYSTGMYQRLAFAVASHLESEILLVDEFLAVGDILFQEKCLDKLQEEVRQGRTVLVVSHNINVLQKICQKAIFIRNGKLIMKDEINLVIQKYLDSLENPKIIEAADRERRAHLKSVIQKVEFLDKENNTADKIPMREALSVRIHYAHAQETTTPSFRIIFTTPDGIKVFRVDTKNQKTKIGPAPAQGIIQCRIPQMILTPGVYFIHVGFEAGAETVDYLEKAARIEVVERDAQLRPKYKNRGLVLVDSEWQWVKS